MADLAVSLDSEGVERLKKHFFRYGTLALALFIAGLLDLVGALALALKGHLGTSMLVIGLTTIVLTAGFYLYFHRSALKKIIEANGGTVLKFKPLPEEDESAASMDS